MSLSTYAVCSVALPTESVANRHFACHLRIDSRIEPTRLVSLETTPMKKVAAGENHTLALSRSGQVFSWGSNSFGQLGHPGKSSSSQSRLTPKRVDAFRFHEMKDIAASGCHSAAIDAEDGAVYTWGSNRRGQLGRKEGCGTDQADATPRSVDALRPRHPMCVVYGDYDSVQAEKLALSVGTRALCCAALTMVAALVRCGSSAMDRTVQAV